MVNIKESGMVFGPFPEDGVYQIEKSDAYMGLGEGVKVVEFIYRQNTEKIFFVEAKSSSPKPETENFREYISMIADKFVHSFNLWLSLKLNRRNDTISSNMLDIQIDKQVFSFVLVINGHEKMWLPPIKEAIEKKMIAEKKIWKHEIIVLNDVIAKERGWINS